MGAVDWLRDVLLGSVATSVAVLAVAVVGLLMLSGRVPVRRGATVVIGCFVLFSAAMIADGLLSAARGGGDAAAFPPAAPQPAYTPAVPKPAPYDPYAGASVLRAEPRPIIQ
ncbi:TrbC/VirB2 family protein [Sphingomonas lenta]|uniref:TrbC/VirB2 family protein n=1 Tax=Sphingomonas lenta TaxID=1141887 RepID=UPI002481D6EA|nr:TrbC/VirB2 family protein [Sphingomonas lenta]